LQELERQVQEQLDVELHPKFQQALLNIHWERQHEHTTQIQHTAASDVGVLVDLTRFTAEELQENLQ
jgi:hypothetical protein